MTEQDKAEIRKIIKEEIEAKFSIPSPRSSPNVKEPFRRENDNKKGVFVETVSPAY
jgi:hypothetical protein